MFNFILKSILAVAPSFIINVLYRTVLLGQELPFDTYKSLEEALDYDVPNSYKELKNASIPNLYLGQGIHPNSIYYPIYNINNMFVSINNKKSIRQDVLETIEENKDIIAESLLKEYKNATEFTKYDDKSIVHLNEDERKEIWWRTVWTWVALAFDRANIKLDPQTMLTIAVALTIHFHAIQSSSADMESLGDRIVQNDKSKEEITTGTNQIARTNTALRLRRGPNIGSEILMTLPKDLHVHIISRHEIWNYVEFTDPEDGNVRRGWVHSSYLAPD
ncbi:MAG: SH3 domain-containing protein [Bacteroidota bacterium]